MLNHGLKQYGRVIQVLSGNAGVSLMLPHLTFA